MAGKDLGAAMIHKILLRLRGLLVASYREGWEDGPTIESVETDTHLFLDDMARSIADPALAMTPRIALEIQRDLDLAKKLEQQYEAYATRKAGYCEHCLKVLAVWAGVEGSGVGYVSDCCDPCSELHHDIETRVDMVDQLAVKRLKNKGP